MRRVTWRFWVPALTALAVYFFLGSWAGFQNRWDDDIYKWGLTAVVAVVMVFVLAYTAYGLAVKGSARWWKTDLGTSLVVVTLAMLPWAGGLAWVFWFQNGLLHPGTLAWIEISGPLIEAVAVAWRSYVWLRVAEYKRRSDG